MARASRPKSPAPNADPAGETPPAADAKPGAADWMNFEFQPGPGGWLALGIAWAASLALLCLYSGWSYENGPSFWLGWFAVVAVLLFLLRYCVRAFDATFLVLAGGLMYAATREWGRTRLDFHFGYVADLAEPSMHGALPFVDSFTQYGFVTALWQGWFMRLFGATQPMLFLSVMVFVWLGLASLYYLCLKLMPRWAAAWTCFLYIVFFDHMAMPWPNYVLGGLTLLFAALLTAAVEREGEGEGRRRTWLLLASGLVGGLLPWTRQQGLFPLLAGGAGWVALCWLRAVPWRRTGRDVLAAFVGAMVTGGGILAAIVFRGGWRDLWLDYVEMARGFSAGGSGELDSGSALEAGAGLLNFFFNNLTTIWVDYWRLVKVSWTDYTVILVALFAALALPFWRRYLGDDAAEGDSPLGLGRPVGPAPTDGVVAFLLGMILLPGLTLNYPMFEEFRLWPALGAGLAVVVFWLTRPFARLTPARRVWAAIPVLAVTLFLAAPRITEFGRSFAAAAVSAAADRSGQREGGLLPMLRGIPLSADFAAQEAGFAYTLDSYLKDYPGTPVVSEIPPSAMSLLPYFLVGHPAYALPTRLRYIPQPSWPQDVQDQRYRQFNAFVAEKRSLVAGEYSMFRQLPADSPQAVIYRGEPISGNSSWGTSDPCLLAPRERAEEYRRRHGRWHTLANPAAREALARKYPDLLTHEKGRVVVKRAGRLPLDMIPDGAAERYPNLAPWLVVGLDAASLTPERGAVTLTCRYREEPRTTPSPMRPKPSETAAPAKRSNHLPTGADSPVAEASRERSLARTVESGRERTFFPLTRGRLGGWGVEFPENAVGCALTALELYPDRPEEIARQMALPGRPAENRYVDMSELALGVKNLGGEGRVAAGVRSGRSLDAGEVFEVPAAGLLKFGIGVDQLRNGMRPGEGVVVELALAFDDGSVVTRQWAFEATELQNPPRWYDQEVDCSAYAGKKGRIVLSTGLAGQSEALQQFSCRVLWSAPTMYGMAFGRRMAAGDPPERKK